MMCIRILTAFFALLCSAPLWSITCYFTLVKDNCWAGYNVSVDVINTNNSAILTTVTVPKGKQWVQQTFPCEPAQKLMYHARFTPVFWSGEEGKTYSALNYWSLPSAVNPGDTAWNVSVCYPGDFALVPLPPDAQGTCKCDFSAVPELKTPIIEH